MNVMAMHLSVMPMLIALTQLGVFSVLARGDFPVMVSVVLVIL